MNTMNTVQSSFLKYEEDEAQYSREDITVSSGQNLAMGTVLGKVTASGEFAAYDPTASDGTQTAAGILIAAVNATAADAAGVAIVRHAVVVKEGLVWGAGVTTTPHKTAAYAALKTAGIVSRNAI